MNPSRHRLIAGLLCWSLIVGVLVRLRIQHDVLLPPSHPFAWLLIGLLQDVAVLAFAAVLTLLVGRWRPMERIGTIAFGAFVVVVTLLQIVRSEAVVFYGEVIRPEDLHGDVPIAVALRSLTGVPLMLFVISIVLLGLTFLMVRRASAQRTIHLRPGSIMVTGCLAALLSIFLSPIVPRSGLARNPIVALLAFQHELLESPHTRFAVAAPTLPVTSIREFAPTSEHRIPIDSAYPLAYLAGSHNELAAISPR